MKTSFLLSTLLAISLLGLVAGAYRNRVYPRPKRRLQQMETDLDPECLATESSYPGICKQCDASDNYYYMLLNPTYVACAYAANESAGTPCVVNTTIYTELPGEFMPQTNFSLSIWAPYLESNNYCIDQQFYGWTTVCQQQRNLSTYFPIDWADLNSQNPVFNFTSIRESIVMNSVDVYCDLCILTSKPYLYFLDPFNSVDGAYTPLQMNYVGCIDKSLATCDQYSVVSSTSATGCAACNTLYDNCLACNSTQCTMCPLGYYWNPQVWDERYQMYTGKCLFQVCPTGNCADIFGYKCYPSTLNNCVKCQAAQGCLECKAGYVVDNTPGVSQGTCILRTTAIDNRDRFVRPMDTDEVLDSYPINTNAGLTMETAAFSIHKVINDLYTSFNNGTYSGASLNIYLLKGVHILLECTGDPMEVKMFSANPNLTNVCSGLNLYRQDTMVDSINITVQPLYCSLQTELGLGSDTNFTDVCVDLTVDNRPTILVNGPYSYFNITGTWQFINLMFDATNSIVSDPKGKYDYSVIPAELCQITQTPNGYDSQLQLTTIDVADLTLGFQCQDQYTPTRFPSSTAYKCQQTLGLQLYPQIQSSLSCARTYDNTDYFFQNPNGAYSKKQRTLFNLYAFSGYETTQPLLPSLYIFNCTFDYFYGGFDSLINLEQGTLSTSMYNNNAYFIYFGRVSGGNVTLNQTSITNSRFCRGMIFFRKLTYDIDYSMSLVNQTYLYDTTNYTLYPYLKKSGIILNEVTVQNANSYKYVTALANYGGMPTYASIDQNAYQPLLLLQPIHVGIAINIEDYPGFVIIQNSNFDKNMHYLGEYNNTVTFDTERQDASSFLYTYDDYTSEYKLAMCEDYLSETFQLFGHGFFQDEQAEMEDYFDFFERLSLIYISRSNGLIYIANNTFTNNIGTFGGAITINTPMWSKADTSPPQIIFEGNNFTSNMAYISGNAVYIRTAKNGTDYNSSCSSGIMFDSNYFGYNIGTKIHNGGAVSVVCTYLDYNYLIEQSSAISITLNKTWFNAVVNDMMLFGMNRGVFTSPVQLNMYDLRIQNNTFEYNFAGQNGSAIFISQPTNVTVFNSVFQYNGAVYSFLEQIYSPFYKYLSWGVPFSFYDQIHNFTDEVDFMITKGYSNGTDYGNHSQFSGNIAQYKIQYPQIKGALSIFFCQIDSCLQNMVETILIQNSSWHHNYVGPLLIDNFEQDMASCIYTYGGLNVSYLYNNFSYNQGPPGAPTNYTGGDPFYWTFINNQTSLGQSSMIVMTITNNLVTNNLTQYFLFENCSFSNNMNFQYYDQLPVSTQAGIFYQTDTTYYGQLIRLVTNYNGNTNNFAAYFLFYNNTVFNNTFLGTLTSQIYVNEAIAKFYQNTFIGNGALINYPDYYQEKSVVTVENSAAFYPYWSWCECVQNVFEYNMGYLGAGWAFDVAQQTVELRNNVYVNQISNQYGAALTIYETATYSNSFFNLTFENYTENFGINVYFFTIYDNNVTQCMIVIRNCLFNTMNSNQDALGFYSENLYGLFFINSTFSQNKKLMNNNESEGNWTSIFNNTQAKLFKDNATYLKFNWTFVNNSYQLNNLQTYIYTFNQGIQNWNFWITWYNWQDNALLNLIPIVLSYASTNCPGADIQWQYLNIYNCSFGPPTTPGIFQGILQAESSYVYYYSAYTSMNPKLNPCLIQNQNVQQLGTITIESNSNFIGTNMMFSSNNGFGNGTGSLLNVDNSVFQVNNAVFLGNNYASTPLLKITGDSTFNCYSCNFTNNYAYNGIIYGRGKIQSNLLITNSIFMNNQGQEYMIYLSSCLAELSYTNFTNSMGSQVVIISDAQLNFLQNNVTYDYSKGHSQDFGFPTYFLITTGFFYAAYNSELNMDQCNFNNLNGSQSAVLYASEGSDIAIANSNFVNSSVTTLGGIVYFLGVDTASITNCQFDSNSYLDIELDNSVLQLSGTGFRNGMRQFISASKSSLYVSACTFDILNSQEQFKITGGAIQCECQGFSVTNSYFRYIQAYQGGSIYITSSQNATFTMTGNTFLNNTARQGGAIYVNDAQKMIFSNNTFQNNNVTMPQTNQAQDLAQGGALYLGCDNVDLGLQGNCLYTVQYNQFYNNMAQWEGGGLIWITKGQANLSTNTFSGNSAASYGNDYASFPTNISVQFVTNNDASTQDILDEASVLRGYTYNESVSENETETSSRLLQEDDSYGDNSDSPYGSNNSTFEDDNDTTSSNSTAEYEFGIVSGTDFAFLVTLVDQWGQVVSSDNSSKALITANNKTTSTITFKNNQVSAYNGVYNFSNTIIIVKPGTNFTVQLDFIGVQTYTYPFYPSTNLTNITVTARNCVIGEEYTQDGRCQRCQTGEYSILPPSAFILCLTCPVDAGADCLGGSFIVPLAGYQRSIYHYDEFIQCPIQQNCIAGSQTNRNGMCSYGYYGIVCAQCEAGFSQVKEFQCQKCPDRIRNIIQIAFILFIGIIVIVMLVRSTISSSSKIKPAYSVYLKIMTNHFQILSAIGNIDYQWPQEIQNYYDVQNNVATASQQLYSFDCILDQQGDNEEFPIFFQKLVLIGSIPFLAVIISLAFWMLYFFIQGRRGKSPENFTSSFVSTLVVMLFIFHPDIAKFMFLAFNCERFDGINRLKFHVESVCYQGQHLFFTIAIVIPSVVLWVFGIPFMAIIIMARYRKAIKSVQTLENQHEIDKAKESVTQMQSYYGFLFNGYNAERFYWETIIVLRKVFIIMGAVFFSSVSSESQILVALLIVLLSLILQNSLKPYYSDTLNRMEVMSLTVAAFTMYTGMYYVTGSHYDYMDNTAIQYILLITLATPNVIFLGYWLFHMRIEILKELYKKKWYSFIQILTLSKFEEQKFYEKYLKDDEAFDVEEEQGQLNIKYVGIELHQQLTKFESMRSSDFQTSFATSKQGSEKSKKRINKKGTVAISPMKTGGMDSRQRSFNSTMKFMEETQDDPEIETARGSKQGNNNKKKLKRKQVTMISIIYQDTFDREEIEDIKDDEEVNQDFEDRNGMESNPSLESFSSKGSKKSKGSLKGSIKGSSDGSKKGSNKSSNKSSNKQGGSDGKTDFPKEKTKYPKVHDEGLDELDELEEIQDDSNMEEIKNQTSPQDQNYKGDMTVEMNPIDEEISKMKLSRKEKKEKKSKKPLKQVTTLSDLFN